MDIFPRINMLPHGGAAGDRPDRGRHRTVVGAWIELTRRDAEARALTHGEAGVLLRLAALGTGPATLVLRVVGWTSIAAVCFLLGAVLSRYGWLHAGRASARDPEETLAAQKGSR
jgi:hypothetical protein